MKEMFIITKVYWDKPGPQFIFCKPSQAEEKYQKLDDLGFGRENYFGYPICEETINMFLEERPE